MAYHSRYCHRQFSPGRFGGYPDGGVFLTCPALGSRSGGRIGKNQKTQAPLRTALAGENAGDVSPLWERGRPEHLDGTAFSELSDQSPGPAWPGFHLVEADEDRKPVHLGGGLVFLRQTQRISVRRAEMAAVGMTRLLHFCTPFNSGTLGILSGIAVRVLTFPGAASVVLLGLAALALEVCAFERRRSYLESSVWAAQPSLALFT